MLDFFFLEKGLERATSLLNQIYENKSFESDHQIPSQWPIRRFLTVITNVFRSLKSKNGWSFGNNKSSFENVLFPSTEEASILKAKEIFE